ncbi:MAG: M6 family metalloprotease domain-containing protein, partial [Bacteroidetes bacterium]|nr:M6 family metalloprotease domain-containing protein [Bacteroidota bacterium]
NSMHNYFMESSYQTLNINSHLYPSPSGSVILSYQDTLPRSYYMPFDSATNPDGYTNDGDMREHTLLKNAVASIASQVPPDLNLDYNNDGYVDNVCFIVRGGSTAWATLLWPHMWVLFNYDVFLNNKKIWTYNFQIDDFLAGSGNGVLCHEMSHSLGCPDLYHYNYDGNSTVGGWDVMEANANPPQHSDAHMKFKYLHFIDSIPEITQPGTYTLHPLTSPTNNAYKLKSPNSDQEYFVFEYRKKEGTFENSLPGSGLIIYRINSDLNGNAGGPPDEIYAYRPGGSPTTNGNISLANFSSDVGRTEFNNASDPYDFFTDQSLGDLLIGNITSSGATISFDVMAGNVAMFSAVSPTTTCTYETVRFHDLSTGNPTSWNWIFTPDNVIFVNGTSQNSSNPQVEFLSGGVYSVTLIASNSSGAYSKTKTDYIHIAGEVSAPFHEGFSSGTFATQYWKVANPDNSFTWTVGHVSGKTPADSLCTVIDCYDYTSTGQRDSLISRGIHIPAQGTAKLSFNIAYREYAPDYRDTLQILIFDECGHHFLGNPYTKSDSILATGPPLGGWFAPSSPEDWRTDSIDLSPYNGMTVNIVFLLINGYGNNLYINDINLSTTAPVIAGFEVLNTSVCQNSSVNFSDQSHGAVASWYWEFPGGVPAVSSLQDPYITVHSLPDTPVMPSGPAKLCQGAATSLFQTSDVPGVTGYAWTMSPGAAGSLAGTGPFAIINWNQDFSGNAYVSVAGINSCGIGMSSQASTTLITPLPTVNLPDPDPACINWPPFEMTGGTPSGGTYSGTGINNNFFYAGFAGVGNHQVTYTFADSNSCINSASQYIYVSLCSGIGDEEIQEIRIYPNPASDRLFLSQRSGSQDIENWTVTDVAGKILLAETNTSRADNPVIINTASLSSGLYFFRFSNKNRLYIRKFIVQR